MRSFFDVGVTVSAVHAELASVQRVAIRHWLIGFIADLQICWRKIIPEHKDHQPADHCRTHRSKKREFVELS